MTTLLDTPLDQKAPVNPVVLESHGLTLAISITDVTPQIARDWLNSSDGNRATKTGQITKYVRDMLRGNWMITGQAIEFNTTGVLLDGHHRLLSVIESEVTVPMLVIHGFPTETRNAIDIGAKRTSADQFALEGHDNPSILASAARLAIAWSTGRINQKGVGISEAEIREFVAHNSYLRTAAGFAAAVRRRSGDLHPSVVCAVLWGLVGAGHPEERAREFFLSIADMRTEGPGDPKYALITRVAAARRDRQKLHGPYMLAAVVRAFNADYRGETLSRLPVYTRAQKLVVPEIVLPGSGG